MPHAVPAHRVAGEVDLLRIDLEVRLSLMQHLQRVHSAPVFPIKAVRTAVGRRYDVSP